jgi:hypothetical protein
MGRGGTGVRTALLGLMACCLLASPAVAGAKLAVMSPSEVRTGMKGYGLTAFEGAAPEKFDVEVLGVLRNALPKGDVVLVRMSSPVLDEAGGLAGMSGSPVYVDGKLVGAVAFGWSYCKIPLAGVTPIEDMLRVREIGETAPPGPDLEARAAAARSLRERSRALAELITSAGRPAERKAAVQAALKEMAAHPFLRGAGLLAGSDALPPSVRGLLPAGADPQLRPLPVPLAMGGRLGGREVFGTLEGAGFLAVQAARAAAPEDEAARPDRPLEPGMPVGVVFISGDLDAAGMGTLTVVDGEDVLAFGHELMGAGATDLPLAVGEVRAIVPSIATSFKLTSTGPVVGRITQDRSTGVLGKLGEQAPTFPCRVSVSGAAREDYAFRIAGHWRAAPLFASFALRAASGRWEGAGERHTLVARARISVEGRREPIVRENVYATPSIVPPAMDTALLPVEALLVNPYRDVRIAGLDYELEVIPGFQAALIESVWADRATAKPGAELTVYVRLIEYRGEELVRELRLKVPETAEPGSRIQVLVCDAPTNRMIKQSLDPGLFAPRSFDELVRALEEMEPNRNLVMRASVFEEGVRYAGAAMPALPPSALSILRHRDVGSRAAPLRTDVVQSVETPWVLEGAQTLFITVEEPAPFAP